MPGMQKPVCTTSSSRRALCILTRFVRHLIADHLGWFKESTEDGKLKTVEDLVRAKGEKVKRGTVGEGGVVEYTPE